MVIEKHVQDMAEIQADHDQAMKVLETKIKEAIAKNEDFQKAIDDMDDTLAQQSTEIDLAKQDLDLCISGNKFNDPEIRALQLALEEKMCEVSQLEEKIMHTEDALNDDSSDSSDDEESNKTAPVDQEKVLVDQNMTLRTMTPPQLEKTIPEADLTVLEKRGDDADGVAGDVVVTKLNNRRSTSFNSLFTLPSTIASRRVSANTRSTQSTPGRTLRHKRPTVDREVSSTQN